MVHDLVTTIFAMVMGGLMYGLYFHWKDEANKEDEKDRIIDQRKRSGNNR